MGKKVQVPVMGGLRKVIQIPTQQNAGTTIQEFGSAIVTLAQLKAALGITTSKGTQVAGGGTASLVVGPGLSGGGVLVGPVPIGLTAPIPWSVGDEGGGDGEVGPPGQQGRDGSTGSQGPTGPAVFFLPDDPEDALNAIPGSIGPQGLTGAQGPMGPAVFLEADASEDGQPGPPGPMGPTGATGAAGPIIWMPGDDGEQGDVGPPGPVSNITITGVNVTPDTHPTIPTSQDDEFESGSSINLALWTWVNQGTATATVALGALSFTNPVENSPTLRMVTQVPSGGTWKYAAKTVALLPGVNNQTFIVVGKAGKYIIFGVGNGGSGTAGIVGQRFTNTTTFASSAFATTYTSSLVGPIAQSSPVVSIPVYVEIDYDGTNLTFNFSFSGLPGTYNQASTETAASFLGGAPDAIGLGCYTNNVSSPPTLVVDWFRKLA